jgi:hypothetical protein
VNAKAVKSQMISKVGRNNARPAIMSKGAMNMSKSKSILFAAATAVASLLGIGSGDHANAALLPVTLSSGNSSVTFNPSGTASSTPKDGMNNWSINGVNQINQQFFAFSVGNAASQRLDTLTPNGGPTLLSTNGKGTNFYQQSYINGTSFKTTATYILSAGPTGSETSDISESIKISNTSGAPLNFHLFDYAEFNLGGKTGSETVSITGANTATVADASVGMQSQTVVSPHSSDYQASTTAYQLSPTTITTLQHSIDTTAGLTLDDTATASASSIDGAWGFQWNQFIPTNGSMVISIDKQIHSISISIPEPTSAIAFLGLGGVFLMRPRRRDEDPDPRTSQVAEA